MFAKNRIPELGGIGPQVTPDYGVGTALAASYFANGFLFSGYFVPKNSIPDYWIWFYYLSLFTYALQVPHCHV